MTEAEQKQLAKEEEVARLKAENAAFKTEKRISQYTAQFMAVGYDKDTAENMAKVLPDGIGEDFFAAQAAFIEKQRQDTAVKNINKQPAPSAGTPVSGSMFEDALQQQIRRSAGLKG